MSEQYRPDPSHQRLGTAFFDTVEPADFPSTILRFRNQRWAERVGLADLSEAAWLAHFARFRPLPDNLPAPLALRYHGHQFHTYNPDLGDGRGFLFAQLRDPDDGRLLDLATKGSGQTPWSRGGDGRLTLKGGVREVLATEMLEALGVYTSKSFSLVETGESLMRGDEPSPTRSSVLVRLGHSHVRIGSFQRLAYHQDQANLLRLLDYAIETYWPRAAAEDQAERAARFLSRVTAAVATQAAEWMAAGFVHGVLNTDNTVITGESFDYGPWRFLPRFDPGFTAAYFDHSGLYAFGNQPDALLWNLYRLAECLLPLAPQEPLVQALDGFQPAFDRALREQTLARLGLASAGTEQDAALIEAFYTALQASQLPYEQAFFDLIGGADPRRLAASPHATIYAGPDWTAALVALRAAPKAEGLAAALRHGYFSKTAPVTMLIDEVEALWAPIAERDDWSAFQRKLSDIAALREAYQPLFGERWAARQAP